MAIVHWAVESASSAASQRPCGESGRQPPTLPHAESSMITRHVPRSWAYHVDPSSPVAAAPK